MKIDNPQHVRAYFENLVIASLLVPNYKNDSTVRLFLKQFSEVSEQHGAKPLGFTLQSLLAESKKNVDEPADLLNQFDANLAILADLPDETLKQAFLDTLRASLDAGMEDACSRSRLLDPARNSLGDRSGKVAGRAASAATMIAPSFPSGSAAARMTASKAPGADETMLAPQAQSGPATQVVAPAGAPGWHELQPETMAVTRQEAPSGGGLPKKRSEHLNALTHGYRLKEFEFDKVLGVGGFGITYLGKDTTLNLKVAIKEYFPNELAVRDASFNVQPKSPDYEESYHWGLDRFLQEARLLARFNHPNIVRVLRFFEANGTAYMMMQYEDGESLDEKMKKSGGPLDEATLQGILFPLLDGLKAMHDEGFLHRDIKPGNIYIRRSDSSPVLLDFGAARAQMRANEQVTAIVTPGYAPFEQYFADGCQGPWSDIYAFGAVIYKAITGKPPPDAASRVKNDTMVPTAKAGHGRYSEKFLRAIDWALQTDEKKRPQTIEDWQRALTSLSSVDVVQQRQNTVGIHPSMGETVPPGRYQNPSVEIKSPFSQAHGTPTLSNPEKAFFYQEKQPRRWLMWMFWGSILVGLAYGTDYLAKNPALMREIAFKAADWGWQNQAYQVSLPIYKYYDSPSDAQTPYRVATLFEEGKGTVADKKQAVVWYLKAAERGNPAAALKLAQMLERGDGVDSNVKLAAEWYIKAAEAGEAEAQFRLGIAYLREDALRLKANPGESAKWLRKAALQGNNQARELLMLTR